MPGDELLHGRRGAPFDPFVLEDVIEDLPFAAAPGRSSEGEILDHVLEHERIERGAPAAVQELIARHRLAPVRYTEDESEMNTIG